VERNDGGALWKSLCKVSKILISDNAASDCKNDDLKVVINLELDIQALKGKRTRKGYKLSGAKFQYTLDVKAESAERRDEGRKTYRGITQFRVE